MTNSSVSLHELRRRIYVKAKAEPSWCFIAPRLWREAMESTGDLRFWILADSCPRRIGHITLDQKCAGARSAGNPHAACDAAGAGNGDMVRTEAPALGESRRQQLLPLPTSTAPALDPPADLGNDRHSPHRGRLHRSWLGGIFLER